jgi:hypothetical protein
MRDAERDLPGSGHLHEEVVRMLVIDDRLSLEDLAGLEQLAGARASHRRRIEAGHPRQRKRPARGVAVRHQHPPVRRDELRAAARSALIVEHGPHDAVVHELPSLARGHVHVRVVVLLRGGTSFADDERDQGDRKRCDRPNFEGIETLQLRGPFRPAISGPERAAPDSVSLDPKGGGDSANDWAADSESRRGGALVAAQGRTRTRTGSQGDRLPVIGRAGS